jgi:hypothetical protein
MIGRKNRRSNANVAGVKGKRPGRGLAGVGDVDDAKVEEAAEYVHVRARRGQATDSHSVAERVCVCLSVLLHNLNVLVNRGQEKNHSSSLCKERLDGTISLIVFFF